MHSVIEMLFCIMLFFVMSFQCYFVILLFVNFWKSVVLLCCVVQANMKDHIIKQLESKLADVSIISKPKANKAT